jgi:hypothetical protein
MKQYLKYVACVALVALFGVAVQAATVTNRNQEIEVTLMSEGTDGSLTVVKDQSVWPNMGVDRRGIYVVTYSLPTDSITAAGTVDLAEWEVPKGTILLEDAVIEVSTAVDPTWATNSVAVGGITVIPAGSTFGSTGIKAAVATPGITTSDDEITLTLGAASSNGVFTIYIPVVLGNAQ